MRKVFKYLAKADGRRTRSFRPACLDPLWDSESDCWCFKPKKKADVIGAFFAKKMAQTKEGEIVEEHEVKKHMLKRLPRGWIQLSPLITETEVGLAAKDLQLKKAPGPDLAPNEINKNFPSMCEPLAKLFNSMIQRAFAPGDIRQFFIIPLDTPGQGPTECSRKRLIALLSPMMKPGVLVIVRRMLPIVGGQLPYHQYAYQAARNTET